jgi:hypothetical protein
MSVLGGRVCELLGEGVRSGCCWVVAALLMPSAHLLSATTSVLVLGQAAPPPLLEGCLLWTVYAGCVVLCLLSCCSCPLL